MGKLGLGFPKKLLITHRYVEPNLPLITSGSGALSYYTWSCNSLYDPNVTGIGHQPMYFDQLSALYDHYVVIGSRIKIIVTPANNLQPNAIVGAFVNDDSNVTGTTGSLLENSLVKWRNIPNASTQATVFNLKWSAKKYFGGSIMSDPSLRGTSTSSPTEQSMFTVFLDSTYAGGSAANYNISAVIEYITVWKELREIASS